MKSGLCISAFIFLLYIMSSVKSEDELHFGTKTPYNLDSLPRDYTVPKCNIVYVNSLYRHGTRSPCKADFKNFANLESFLKKNVHFIHNEKVRNWAKGWVNPFSSFGRGSLTTKGMHEHFELGRRFKSTFFPKVLLNNTCFEFETTNKPRTFESFKFFAYGLLYRNYSIMNGYLPVYLTKRPKNEDPFLRFFDYCPVYRDLLKITNVMANAEQNFITENKLSKIAQRLTDDFFGVKVTTDTLRTIYKLCAFQYSVDDISNQWCSLMTPEELRILEYADDLHYYDERGYFDEFSYKISARLLQDFVEKMDAKICGNDKLGTIRFAHAETLIPLIILLEIYDNSEEMRADFTEQQIDDRKFKTSSLSPFAANIAMVLFDCPDEIDRYQVQLFHNEHPIHIPRCNVRYGYRCSLEDFKKQYSEELAINLDELCKI